MISFNNLGNYGRLGNQMFQYASLKGIAENRGFDFCIPPENIFGMYDPNVKNSESNIHNTFDLSSVKTDIINNVLVEESGYNFDENIFNSCEDNVDLIGYFQSEKYFKRIENEIRQDFSFKKSTVDVCKQFTSEHVNSEEIISLHIRRGDYLDLQSYHPTPPIEYYEYCLSKLPDVPVIIFSDDIDWCFQQETFSSEKFFASVDNTAEHDMCLMTMCNYHVIANSSFSWWGAWLSNSKKVMAPKTWFGPSLPHYNTKDLYLDDWEIV